jgi:outer membrane beta-barrel protein
MILCFGFSSAFAQDDKAVKKAGNKGQPEKKAVEVQQDRIKSVQRIAYLKKGRWEFTPMVSVSLNDAFYQKMGGGGSLTYHIADSLALEFHGVYVGTIQTDMVGYFQQANEALPQVSRLQYYLMGSFQWSPIYGKLSLFTDEIIHFDAYILGGFGMAYTEKGSKLASNIGIGLRYYMNSWMMIKLEVRDLIYTETLNLNIESTEFSDVQNHLMLNIGISFVLPVDFRYEYQ